MKLTKCSAEVKELFRILLRGPWGGLRGTGRLSRGQYAAVLGGLAGLKYALDAGVVYYVTGRVWDPIAYWIPMLEPVFEALGHGDWALFGYALWSMPWFWLAAWITAQRGQDAGLGPAVGLLMFLPAINYVAFLTLCLLESRPTPAPKPQPSARLTPEETGQLWKSGLVGAAVGFGLFAVSVGWAHDYGLSLFMLTPFVMGFAAAVHLNRRLPIGCASSIAAGLISLLLTGGALLAFALEGVVCIILAAPLGVLCVIVGVLMGYVVMLAGHQANRATCGVAIMVPLFFAAELPQTTPPPLRRVVTAVDIPAPPEVVWDQVIAFSELPPTKDWIFRIGIAHPTRARLEGHGVGAVRYCEFSTGTFVEPITVWDAPRRLAFRVASQPEPMEELSPYSRVHAPHLLDGLDSKRGEFLLTPLPDGGTRLQGTTWYTLDLAPQPYWGLWSDAIIHRIHRRVLNHVATLAAKAALEPGQHG